MKRKLPREVRGRFSQENYNCKLALIFPIKSNLYYLLFGTDVSTNKRILSHPEDVGRLNFSFICFNSVTIKVWPSETPSFSSLLLHGFYLSMLYYHTWWWKLATVIVPPALHPAKMYENSRGGLTHLKTSPCIRFSHSCSTPSSSLHQSLFLRLNNSSLGLFTTTPLYSLSLYTT